MSDQQITARQRQVLKAIKVYVEEHGYPPAHRELRALLSVSSTNTVVCLLAALAHKGCITITPKASRGLRITEFGHSQLEVPS
jgi:repressor LexA